MPRTLDSVLKRLAVAGRLMPVAGDSGAVQDPARSALSATDKRKLILPTVRDQTRSKQDKEEDHKDAGGDVQEGRSGVSGRQNDDGLHGDGSTPWPTSPRPADGSSVQVRVGDHQALEMRRKETRQSPSAGPDLATAHADRDTSTDIRGSLRLEKITGDKVGASNTESSETVQADFAVLDSNNSGGSSEFPLLTDVQEYHRQRQQEKTDTEKDSSSALRASLGLSSGQPTARLWDGGHSDDLIQDVEKVLDVRTQESLQSRPTSLQVDLFSHGLGQAQGPSGRETAEITWNEVLATTPEASQPLSGRDLGGDNCGAEQGRAIIKRRRLESPSPFDEGPDGSATVACHNGLLQQHHHHRHPHPPAPPSPSPPPSCAAVSPPASASALTCRGTHPPFSSSSSPPPSSSSVASSPPPPPASAMHAANRSTYLAPHRMYPGPLSPALHSPSSHHHHHVSLHPAEAGSPGYDGYAGRDGRGAGGSGGGADQTVAAVIARAYTARVSQPHGDTSRPDSGAQSPAVSLAAYGGGHALQQQQQQEGFPYGLSGVPHMPAYNYSNELFHYATNGFPRKSRICSYCSKVFTRSTTRRYHEGRCPLLRAAGSLMKGREAAAVAANAVSSNGPDSPEDRDGGGGPAAGSGSRPPPLIAITNDSPPAEGSQAGVAHAAAPVSLATSQVTSQMTSSTTSLRTSSPSAAAGLQGPHAASAAYGLFCRSSPTSPQASGVLALTSAASHQQAANLDQNRNSLLSPLKQESGEVARAEGHGLTLHPAFPHLPPASSHGPHLNGKHAQPLFSPLSGASQSPAGSRSDREEDLADSDPEVDRAAFKPPLGLKAEDVYSSPAFLQAYRARLAASMQAALQQQQQPQHQQLQQQQQVKPHEGAEPATPRHPPYSLDRVDVSPLAETAVAFPKEVTNHGLVDTSVRDVSYAAAMETEEVLEEEELEEEEMEEEDYERKACPVCSEPVDSLKVHERLHQRYKPNSCRYCGQRFIKPSMRISHQRLHPQGLESGSGHNSLGCVVCGLVVVTRFGLRQHVHRQHYRASAGHTFCRYCETTLDSVFELKRHFLSHRAQVPKAERLSIRYLRSSTPPVEGARLFTPLEENDEEEEEDEGAHEPKSVESKTSQDSPPIPTSAEVTPSRDEHRVNGSGKGSGSREMEWCRICEKEYPKSFMRYHEREHADQKPYECSICKKRFGYKNNMKSHMKLHAGIKPYQCQICMAKFTRGSTLRRHARRHGINSDSVWDFFLKKSAVQAQALAAAASKPGSQGSPPTAGSRAMKADPSLMASMSKGPELGSAAVSGQKSYPGFPPAAGFSPSGSGVQPTLFNAYPHMVSPAVTQAMLQPYMTMAAQAGYLGYPPPAFPNPGTPAPAPAPLPTPPQHAVQSDALDFSMPDKQRRRSSSSSSTSTSQRPPSTSSQRPPSSSGLQRPPSASTGMSQYSQVIDRSPNRHPAFPPTPLEMVSAQARQQLGERRYPLEERTKEAEEGVGEAPRGPTSGELRASALRSDNYPRPNRPTLSETVESYLDVRPKGGSLRQAPPPLHPAQGRRESYHDFGTQVTLCCAAGSPCSDSSHRRPTSSCGGALDMTKSPTRGGGARLGEDLQHESIASLMASGRLFRCTHCDCFFGDYTMFLVHQKLHLPNRPFACFICREDCRDRLTFSKHLLGHLSYA